MERLGSGFDSDLERGLWRRFTYVWSKWSQSTDGDCVRFRLEILEHLYSTGTKHWETIKQGEHGELWSMFTMILVSGLGCPAATWTINLFYFSSCHDIFWMIELVAFHTFPFLFPEVFSTEDIAPRAWRSIRCFTWLLEFLTNAEVNKRPFVRKTYKDHPVAIHQHINHIPRLPLAIDHRTC